MSRSQRFQDTTWHRPNKRKTRSMTQTTEEHMATPTNEPTLEQTRSTPAKKPVLQLWYHESDLAWLQSIDPFWLHIQRRLGDQIEVVYFTYKPEPKKPILHDPTSEGFCKMYEKDMEEHQRKKQQHQQQEKEALLSDLPRLENETVLFVPCLSPAFLEAFDRSLILMPTLTQVLKNPRFQIMPIVLRPTETGCFSMRPLSTYPEGNERETAFKELVALMEKILCEALHISPRPTGIDYLCSSPATVQPVIASQATTMELVLQALQPVQKLVEQATAQVVEARQLALAERSDQQTVQNLEQKVEVLRELVQAQSSGFWSRLFHKKKS